MIELEEFEFDQLAPPMGPAYLYAAGQEFPRVVLTHVFEDLGKMFLARQRVSPLQDSVSFDQSVHGASALSEDERSLRDVSACILNRADEGLAL